jgi:hypothetical protein
MSAEAQVQWPVELQELVVVTLYFILPTHHPLQQLRLKVTINRGHFTRVVFVCVLYLSRNTR